MIAEVNNKGNLGNILDRMAEKKVTKRVENNQKDACLRYKQGNTVQIRQTNHCCTMHSLRDGFRQK